MVKSGNNIFNVSEFAAKKYIEYFDYLINRYSAYDAMAILFDAALDDEKKYNLLLMNAWRCLTEANQMLKNTKIKDKLQ